jgi:hypothetical protein
MSPDPVPSISKRSRRVVFTSLCLSIVVVLGMSAYVIVERIRDASDRAT